MILKVPICSFVSFLVLATPFVLQGVVGDEGGLRASATEGSSPSDSFEDSEATRPVALPYSVTGNFVAPVINVKMGAAAANTLQVMESSSVRPSEASNQVRDVSRRAQAQPRC